MAHVTVVYKFNGKLNVGVLDKNANIDHFDSLIVSNPKGFSNNTFYVMVTEDDNYHGMVNIDRVTCDIDNSDEDDMVLLANKALVLHRGRTTYH